MKKSVVSVVSASSRGFFCFEACPENRKARSDGLNMADLRKKKMEEDKTDSMLGLGFNKGAYIKYVGGGVEGFTNVSENFL